MISQTEKVIENIKRLPVPEQQKIFEWFEEYRPHEAKGLKGKRNETKLLQKLLEDGLISEITLPMTDEEDAEFAPIEIEGEPLSEIIIRERG